MKLREKGERSSAFFHRNDKRNKVPLVVDWKGRGKPVYKGREIKGRQRARTQAQPTRGAPAVIFTHKPLAVAVRYPRLFRFERLYCPVEAFAL